MEVIRYAFLWPIILLGGLGYINKHDLWLEAFIFLVVGALALLVGCIVWAWHDAKPEMERMKREREASHAADVDGEVQRRLSPPQ